MISKNKIKLLRSLQLKKNRLTSKLTIIEGSRIIDEAINLNAEITHIFYVSKFFEKNKSLLTKIDINGIPYDTIELKDLKKIADTNNPQGIIAVVNIKKYLDSKLTDTNQNYVILDQISDPGNLGTILRTCAWYGINQIVLMPESVDPFNLKCLRSAMGAHFSFNYINYSDYDKIISFLEKNNYNILCSNLNGSDVSKISVKGKWALVLGSEARGTNLLFEKFNNITISKKGSIDSLNVSVATGIILDRLINFSTNL